MFSQPANPRVVARFQSHHGRRSQPFDEPAQFVMVCNHHVVYHA